MDFPASKLRDGYGIFVVNLLNSLADSALSSRQHKWRLPSYPPEEDDIEGKLNDIKNRLHSAIFCRFFLMKICTGSQKID